ncbi:MAG: hypothetical protein QGD94_10675 [Planctomycetia bacterium]|nr:hypothetical protein [Planctomycetia bacterium]
MDLRERLPLLLLGVVVLTAVAFAVWQVFSFTRTEPLPKATVGCTDCGRLFDVTGKEFQEMLVGNRTVTVDTKNLSQEEVAARLASAGSWAAKCPHCGKKAVYRIVRVCPLCKKAIYGKDLAKLTREEKRLGVCPHCGKQPPPR